MKEQMFAYIDRIGDEMKQISDQIFDNPELGLEEWKASGWLTDWLEKQGFTVQRGIAGVDTAFKAVWKQGEGGPDIGLLCEYDALPELGHACGHQLQGPAILAAAAALKQLDISEPYQLTVYGTPAEESVSGKIRMIQGGCTFEELDVALMMHGSGETQTDIKSLAMSKFTVIYHGTSSHAAVKPESGRSALDGLLLAFQGMEFLREHVPPDVKIHYTIVECGGTPANIVPARATASFYVRADNRTTLDAVIQRFQKVLQGASMMTETEVEIIAEKEVDNKIPVLRLNQLLMEQAELIQAPRLRAPREKTGSTDFGNVMHRVPGACIRVAFVPEGTASHSEAYVAAGKTAAAKQAILDGAKILSGAVLELIERPELLAEIAAEFQAKQALETAFKEG